MTTSNGYLREHSALLALLLRFSDILTVASAGFLAYLWRFDFWHNVFNAKTYRTDDITAFTISIIFTFLVFSHFPLYQTWRGVSLWKELSTILSTWTFVWLFLFAGTFVLKVGSHFSRGWIIMWYAIGAGMLITARIMIRLILRYFRYLGFNTRSICLIGTSQCGEPVYDHIIKAKSAGFHVKAVFGDIKNAHSTIPKGSIEEAVTWLNSNNIDQVWFALPADKINTMREICSEINNLSVDIRYVPDIYTFQLINHSIIEIAGLPLVNLSVSPMDGVNKIIKRIEDITFAAAILLIISPIMLLIAIAVKATSKGPVLFKQARHGWNGDIITVWKFRTMYVHHEPPGKITQAQKHDSRITPLGRFLRRTSLDEFPQFFNVLQGRMSIVGPRPHAVEHNEFYEKQIQSYMQRHKVKPGITGWAQINGYRGETKNLEQMAKRIEYDIYYIENWSLQFDIKIIILTIFKGFIDKNAY